MRGVPAKGRDDEAISKRLKAEGDRLVKYFFACLTIPEEDLWVNLSPYEKDRMVPKALGETALGRDLLAQDYILKQLTASLIYPEKSLGKEFWQRVYTKAQQLYGSSQVPVNTFNKVWILADKATVYEHGQTAFVLNGHLKVMLEEDYLAMNKSNIVIARSEHSSVIASERSERSNLLNSKKIASSPTSPRNDTSTLASQIVKDVIIPELEKEVNTGKNFAPLRQIFNSLILATWYKKNLKEALLTQVYADKSTVKGVDLADTSDKENIYQQYLQAYKKGVFNYIKEESPVILSSEGLKDPNHVSLRGSEATEAISKGTTIPRKYFSGGFGANINLKVATDQRTAAMMAGKLQGNALYRLPTVLDAGSMAMTAEGVKDFEEKVNAFIRLKNGNFSVIFNFKEDPESAPGEGFKFVEHSVAEESYRFDLWPNIDVQAFMKTLLSYLASDKQGSFALLLRSNERAAISAKEWVNLIRGAHRILNSARPVPETAGGAGTSAEELKQKFRLAVLPYPLMKGKVWEVGGGVAQDIVLWNLLTQALNLLEGGGSIGTDDQGRPALSIFPEVGPGPQQQPTLDLLTVLSRLTGMGMSRIQGLGAASVGLSVPDKTEKFKLEALVPTLREIFRDLALDANTHKAVAAQDPIRINPAMTTAEQGGLAVSERARVHFQELAVGKEYDSWSQGVKLAEGVFRWAPRKVKLVKDTTVNAPKGQMLIEFYGPDGEKIGYDLSVPDGGKIFMYGPLLVLDTHQSDEYSRKGQVRFIKLADALQGQWAWQSMGQGLMVEIDYSGVLNNVNQLTVGQDGEIQAEVKDAWGQSTQKSLSLSKALERVFGFSKSLPGPLVSEEAFIPGMEFHTDQLAEDLLGTALKGQLTRASVKGQALNRILSINDDLVPTEAQGLGAVKKALGKDLVRFNFRSGIYVKDGRPKENIGLDDLRQKVMADQDPRYFSFWAKCSSLNPSVYLGERHGAVRFSDGSVAIFMAKPDAAMTAVLQEGELPATWDEEIIGNVMKMVEQNVNRSKTLAAKQAVELYLRTSNPVAAWKALRDGSWGNGEVDVKFGQRLLDAAWLTAAYGLSAEDFIILRIYLIHRSEEMTEGMSGSLVTQFEKVKSDASYLFQRWQAVDRMVSAELAFKAINDLSDKGSGAAYSDFALAQRDYFEATAFLSALPKAEEERSIPYELRDNQLQEEWKPLSIGRALNSRIEAVVKRLIEKPAGAEYETLFSMYLAGNIHALPSGVARQRLAAMGWLAVKYGFQLSKEKGGVERTDFDYLRNASGELFSNSFRHRVEKDFKIIIRQQELLERLGALMRSGSPQRKEIFGKSIALRRKLLSLAHVLSPEPDAAMMAATISPADKTQDKAMVPGGIDLGTADQGLTVTKDAQGGVKVNFDPAMIERIKREGIQSAVPVIINVTPMTMMEIRPLLGLAPTKEEEERLAGA